MNFRQFPKCNCLMCNRIGQVPLIIISLYLVSLKLKMFRVNVGEHEITVDAETADMLQTDTAYAESYLVMLRKQFPGVETEMEDNHDQDSFDRQSTPTGDDDEIDAHSCSASAKKKKQSFKWTHKSIMLLLDTYKDFIEIFKNGNHKVAWQKITSVFNEQGYQLTWQQCQIKMDTLKRRYKTIKDHEKSTGSSPITWEYYSIIDELFGNKKWAKPLEGAIASTSGMSATTSKIDVPKPGCSKNTTPKKKVEEKIVALIREFREEKQQIKDRKKQNEEKSVKKEEIEARKEERHREKMEQREELIKLLKIHLKKDKSE